MTDRQRFYRLVGPLLYLDEVAAIYRLDADAISRHARYGTFYPPPIYAEPWRWLAADIEADFTKITGRLCPMPAAITSPPPPSPPPGRKVYKRRAVVAPACLPSTEPIGTLAGAAPPWCESWCPWRDVLDDLCLRDPLPNPAFKWTSRNAAFDRWQRRTDRTFYEPTWGNG